MFETQSTDETKKLSSLAHQASQVEGESGFMKPGEKKKNKGGRPPLSAEEKARREQEKHFKKQETKQSSGPGPMPGQDQTQSSANIPSHLIAKPFCHAISSLAVTWTDDPRATATPDELEAMAQAMGMLLDKYMPTLASQYGPEMAFVLIFGQYGLRVAGLKKLNRLEKEEKEKQKSARADIVEQTKPQEFSETAKVSQANPLNDHRNDFSI